ncbi:MAG: FAD-dependent oxidoreductase [Planctomycetota bacterium]|nr:FAD-dependent oxidoreductase [Planctomycetota bacterium]MDA1214024.1 FAD-dependent oxidoreductase [Planctomycetota bacterium]
MSLRISDLRLPVGAPEEKLTELIARRLKLPRTDITRWRILRKSLDARSRQELKFVFSVVVELPTDVEVHVLRKGADAVDHFVDEGFDDPLPGPSPLEDRPIVVGSGPAGLLAGYYLALKGFRPLILERGKAVKERVPAIRLFDSGGPHDRENNYLFGEGGAGCFSDGKLTCRMSGSDVDWVLASFVECGGRESLTYEHRPHLGSNKLPMICRNYRRKIEVHGGEYRFDCCVERLDIQNGEIRGVYTSQGYLKSAHVILAIGHSARDTYHMLHELGVPIVPKAFQLGLRIEHPQEDVNRIKYGRPEYIEQLGAADYTLTARGQRDLFSFCMCAGGIVIPSVSEPEMFCSNGMSNSRHDTSFANSGLVVTLDPTEFGSDHPLAGVHLQQRYESLAFLAGDRDYLCPIQRASDYLANTMSDRETKFDCSYARGVKAADLTQLLPDVITRAIQAGLPIMDKKWKGSFLKHAVLVGPEMRGSSPVRIPRDRDTRQTPGIAGLYPVGEGAGYAGGIVSAAVDGLRTAREIVRRYASLDARRF